MTAATGTKPTATRELTLTRVFDAPRAVVFKMWTDATHLSQWWGPKGFTNPVCELDLRPDGALRIVMRAPNGAEFPMKGVFREIVAPERLVFTNIAVDQDGNHIIEGLTTVTFTALGGKTKLTLHTTAAALTAQAARMIEGMDAGWTQSIDKLEAYLPRAGS